MSEEKNQRGRKTKEAQPIEHAEVDEEKIGGAMVAMRDDAKQEQQAIVSDVFSLGRNVGAALMANMMKSFSAAAEIHAFREINESKSFRHLAIRMPDGVLRSAENIDEFCQVVFGRGYKAMNNHKVMLEQLGEETYENANRLGLNRGQLRLLLTLPEDERTAVEDAMKSSDKSEVVSLIQSLANKLDETRTQVEELKAENAADKELLATRAKDLAKLRTQEKRIKPLEPDDVLAELRQEVTSQANDAEAAIIGQLRQGFYALVEHHATNGGDSFAFMGGIVGQLNHQLQMLRDEFDLPLVNADAAPEWVNAAAGN